jgi:hypothetical protein
MKCRLHTDDSTLGKERLLLVVIVAMFSIVHGCASRENIESARSRGVEAGKKDGQCAGEAEGFRNGFKEAEARSYKKTLSELYSSGDYYRPPFYEIAAFVAFFVLGFALQYAVFFLLRVFGFLPDIDWIVLSPEAIEKIKNCSEQQSPVSLTQEQTRLIPTNTVNGQRNN